MRMVGTNTPVIMIFMSITTTTMFHLTLAFYPSLNSMSYRMPVFRPYRYVSFFPSSTSTPASSPCIQALSHGLLQHSRCRHDDIFPVPANNATNDDIVASSTMNEVVEQDGGATTSSVTTDSVYPSRVMIMSDTASVSRTILQMVYQCAQQAILDILPWRFLVDRY
jgi:hypothetical protein